MKTYSFEDKLKGLNGLELKELLNINNVKYKVRDLGKYLRYSIDNADSAKLERGYSKSKGKSIIYVLTELNFIFLISNSYGWNGSGSPYTTDNFFKILTGSNKDIELLIAGCNTNIIKMSLIDIENKMKNYFKIKINKIIKFDSLESFAKNNKDLLKKYILDTFNTKILFNNLKSLKTYIRFQNENLIIPIDFNLLKGVHPIELNKNYKEYSELFKKINSKLLKPITYLNLKDFKSLLFNLNIPFEELSICLFNNIDTTYFLKIGSKVNTDELFKLNFNKKATYNISFNDNTIYVEEKLLTIKLMKGLSNFKNIEISEEKLIKILSILNND